MRRIGNLVGGKPVEATSGRFAPVFNPATGEQSGEVGLSSEEDVDLAVKAAKAALPGLGGHAPAEARPLHVQVQGAPRGQWRRDRPRDLGRARQDPLGCLGGGPARARSRRVCLRHSSPPGRRFLAQCRCRRSTPMPTASPSASSPASRRSTSRRWCRYGCTRSPSPAATPSSSSPRSAIPRPRSKSASS